MRSETRADAAGRSTGLALGVLCEDLHGALAAVSRLRQRGLRVLVVDDPTTDITPETDVVAVDMRLLDVAEETEAVAEQWTAWLMDRRCARVEQRISTEFRGSPAAVLRGMLRARSDRPVLVVSSAYPPAGCVCIDGDQIVHHRDGAAEHFSVAKELGYAPDVVATVSVDSLTAGIGVALAEAREAIAAGVEVIVFDAVNEAHIEAVSDVVAALERETALVAVTSGAWLRFHPRLDQDGFVVVASAGARSIDRAQLARVADVFGGTARVSTPSTVLAESQAMILESLALHRVVVLEPTDRRGEDRDFVADEIAAAVRRLLDVSLAGPNPALGVVVSGGLSSGRTIRALDPDGLLPGNELEPLCPVVRTVGGPFPHLPVVTKASAVGTPDTLVRLVRRITGT